MWIDPQGKLRKGGPVGILFMIMWTLLFGWLLIKLLGAPFADSWTGFIKLTFSAVALLVVILGCIPARHVMDWFETWAKDHNLNG